MIELNPLWNVWIVKSLAIHFQTGLPGIKLYCEGQERDTEKEEEHVELRIDGPNIKEYTKDCWSLYLEVNLLLSVVQNPEANIFRMQELQGQVAQLMVDAINVSSFDSNGCVTGSLGCLNLAKERNQKTQISYFGKIRPDTRLLHSTVESHYTLHMD